VLGLAASLLGACAGGCRTAPEPARPSATEVLDESHASSGTPSETPTRTGPVEKLDESEVQALVMSMVDDYLATLGELVYLHLRSPSESPRQRWIALSILRNGTGAALDIGTGRNPTTDLLDLLVLVRLQRSAIERHWIPDEWPALDPESSLSPLRELEETCWEEAGLVLDDAQRVALKELIDHWIEVHPEQRVVELVRVPAFAKTRNVSNRVRRGQAIALLRDVNEATRAIDDARLLGERALWASSRLPYVLGQQV
jgi:hypothetical protein